MVKICHVAVSNEKSVFSTREDRVASTHSRIVRKTQRKVLNEVKELNPTVVLVKAFSRLNGKFKDRTDIDRMRMAREGEVSKLIARQMQERRKD